MNRVDVAVRGAVSAPWITKRMEIPDLVLIHTPNPP